MADRPELADALGIMLGIMRTELGGVYREVDGTPVYDFSGVDEVYDRVLGLGLRPVVELSFMPRDLASDATKTVFAYGRSAHRGAVAASARPRTSPLRRGRPVWSASMGGMGIYEDERTVSRADLAAWLRQVASQLEAGGQLFYGAAGSVTVADKVHCELEIEREDDEISVEIEFSWTAPEPAAPSGESEAEEADDEAGEENDDAGAEATEPSATTESPAAGEASGTPSTEGTAEPAATA